VALQALDPALKASMLQLASDHSGLRNVSCSIGHKKKPQHTIPILNLTAEQQTTLHYISPLLSMPEDGRQACLVLPMRGSFTASVFSTSHILLV